jgi:diguanylate cyclase (GGDEF)-like protein
MARNCRVHEDQRALRSISRKEGEFTLLLDEQFDIIWHSESLSAILGWGDVRGRNGTEFVHPDDLGLVLETMLQANHAHAHSGLQVAFAPEASDIRIADAHGTWHTFETTTWNHLQDDDVRAVLCTCRRVQDRSDLARAIDLLGSGTDVHEVMPVIARLADHSFGGGEVRTAIAWIDEDGVVLVSASGGEPLEPLLAQAAHLVWSQGLREPRVIADLDDPLLSGAGELAAGKGYRGAFLVPIEAPTGPNIIGAMVAWGSSTVDFQAPTQSPIHVALRLAALAIADHHLKRRLRWAAAHDPLTGLANRAEFAHRLDELADGELVLLYIDLDDFKPINDQHGHPVGDKVLIEVGRRIASVIGPHDVVGRLGGDEFAVIVAGTGDPSHGRAVADRIVEAIRQPLLVDGLRLSVQGSVGVAVGAQPLIPAVLVRQADEALYQAKQTGKNTVCLAS